MNTAEPINDARRTEDDLLQLQLRIARRADELAQSRGSNRDGNADWAFWLQAERDVVHHLERPVTA